MNTLANYDAMTDEEKEAYSRQVSKQIFKSALKKTALTAAVLVACHLVAKKLESKS